MAHWRVAQHSKLTDCIHLAGAIRAFSTTKNLIPLSVLIDSIQLHHSVSLVPRHFTARVFGFFFSIPNDTQPPVRGGCWYISRYIPRYMVFQ